MRNPSGGRCGSGAAAGEGAIFVCRPAPSSPSGSRRPAKRAACAGLVSDGCAVSKAGMGAERVTHVAHELTCALPLDADGAVAELGAVHALDELGRAVDVDNLEVAVRERATRRAVCP